MISLFNKIVINAFVMFGVVIAFIGCYNASKADNLFYIQLSESLERSNLNLQQSTDEIYNALNRKKDDISMVEKATIWTKKADTVRRNSENAFSFLDSLQSISSKMNDRQWQTNLLRLDPIIKLYQASILSSDDYERKAFDRRIKIDIVTSNETMDSLGKKALLLKLKNDVRNTEYFALKFCNNQVGMLDGPGFYDRFAAMASANTTRLGVNEVIIIQAGVGEFSTMSKPSFIINRDTIAANDNAIGEYRMNVGNKPGKYKVPVKVSFTTQNGKHEVFETKVEYTVVE